jgi:hypothetical protein
MTTQKLYQFIYLYVEEKGKCKKKKPGWANLSLKIEQFFYRNGKAQLHDLLG